MFISVYKTTLKNLFRSVTFWLCFAVMVIVAIQNAMTGFHSVYNSELKELINDTDPRYVLEYRTFIQWINNSVTMVLQYIIPIFAVITTVIILNRDYGDHFYEIEKAGGMKPSNYLFGKITALITVNYILSVTVNFLETNLYILTRNCVNGIDAWDSFWDSTVRLLRIDFFRILPCVVFYVCLTYFIGALFKSKIFAAVSGMGYAVFCYAFSLFSVKKSGLFVNYLTHNPMRLRNYFHYYDTEWFEDIIKTTNTSLTDAALCISFLIGVGVLCSAASYLLIRKRST